MKYQKNGRECILCATRKKLIYATPEELIRQEYLQRLIVDYEVPIEMIDVEVLYPVFKRMHLVEQIFWFTYMTKKRMSNIPRY